MKYKECPRCKRKPDYTPIFGSHFTVYRCKDCGREFCGKCSNDGKNCPNCGKSNPQRAGSTG